MKLIYSLAVTRMNLRSMESFKNSDSIVEDILSDEYEEGEILDDDIIFYENVSSLEEFSDAESDKKLSGNRCGKIELKKVKMKRKKEHKCKVESVCREERSGKHCYARIRKRRINVDSKSKNSLRDKVVKSNENDKKVRSFVSSRLPSVVRGIDKSDVFNKPNQKNRLRYPNGRNKPFYYNNYSSRSNLNRTKHERSNRNRQISSDKKKPSSPNVPVQTKLLHEANRTVAKSSLLDRLVKAGSLSQKPCEEEEISYKLVNEEAETVTSSISDITSVISDLNVENAKEIDDLKQYNLGNLDVVGNSDVIKACAIEDICPEDIPIPPSPKAPSPLPEPKKEEIDELHLRLIALKTAIMKKHSDLKRKKLLTSSNKTSTSVDDSFKELVLMDVGDLFDDSESISTPPPPGTDTWPDRDMPLRDLDDPHWSDEDMIIDQESICTDTIIEANIPMLDPNFDSFALPPLSPSSQSELPCCKGNPIPVVTPHRPAKEIDERRGTMKPTNSIISVPCTARHVEMPSPTTTETPKYLKEINFNRRSLKRKRSAKRLRPRRNLTRQKPSSAATIRRLDRSSLPKDVVSEQNIVEVDDDEDELRKLALMSVKPKSSTVSNDDSPPVDIEAPLDIKSEPDVKNALETWEDIDEDILRAQLLSSLSRRIPEGPPVIPTPPLPSMATSSKRFVKPIRKEILTKKINKENLYAKRNTMSKIVRRNTKKFVIPTSMNPPVVDKFIIKVSNSDTSEDEQLATKFGHDSNENEAEQKVIESSIDKLLEQARKETDLIQKASSFYPVYDIQKDSSLPEDIKEQADSLSSECNLSSNRVTESQEESSTLSSLPLWQLEEFDRQKKAMAIKGRVIEATKKRIRQERGRELSETKRSKEDAEITATAKVGKAEASNRVDAGGKSGGTESQFESENVLIGSTNKTTCHTVEPSNDHFLLDSTEGNRMEDVSFTSLESEVKNVIDRLLSAVSGLVHSSDETLALSSNPAVKTGNTKLIHSVLNDPRHVTSTIPQSIQPSVKSISASSKPPNKTSIASSQNRQKPIVTKLIGSPIVPQKKTVMAPLTLRKADKPITANNHKRIVIKSTKQNVLPLTSLIHSAKDTKKPMIHLKDSSYTLKALNEMTDIVNEFEDSVSSYKNLRKDYVNLRKQLIVAHQKVVAGRKKLFEMRDTIENKKRILLSTINMDKSSLSPLPDSREQPKQSSRAAELLNLKFKEVCLRAQFATMKLDNGIKVSSQTTKVLHSTESVQPSPRKRLKMKPKSNTANSKLLVQVGKLAQPEVKNVPTTMPAPDVCASNKLVITVRNKDEMDPLIPLCPYDNKGVCKDEECKYQHLRFE